MGFDPCNCSLKIWDSNSQNGSSFGSVSVHSFTLSYTLRSMKCDSRASLLARTLASSCLGHKPKARVATITTSTSRRSLICISTQCLSIKHGTRLAFLSISCANFAMGWRWHSQTRHRFNQIFPFWNGKRMTITHPWPLWPWRKYSSVSRWSDSNLVSMERHPSMRYNNKRHFLALGVS
jgi:hypothetical protein